MVCNCKMSFFLGYSFFILFIFEVTRSWPGEGVIACPPKLWLYLYIGLNADGNFQVKSGWHSGCCIMKHENLLLEFGFCKELHENAVNEKAFAETLGKDPPGVPLLCPPSRCKCLYWYTLECLTVLYRMWFAWSKMKPYQFSFFYSLKTGKTYQSDDVCFIILIF